MVRTWLMQSQLGLSSGPLPVRTTWPKPRSEEPGRTRRGTWDQPQRHGDTKCRVFVSLWLVPSGFVQFHNLLVVPAHDHCLTANMSLHRLQQGRARVGGLLRSTGRHIEFGIQSIEFERVMMVRSGGRRARTHVAVAAQADLTAAVGQFCALCDAFSEAR